VAGCASCRSTRPSAGRASSAIAGVAARDTDSVSNPRYTLVQAIRHLRYVTERFGITKRDLHVVPHGLRHQYGGDEFRACTGVAPPVEGGPQPPRDVDRASRQKLAEQLEHSRTAITTAYLGRSSVTRRRGQRARRSSGAAGPSSR
jgi:hypothetical protein